MLTSPNLLFALLLVALSGCAQQPAATPPQSQPPAAPAAKAVPPAAVSAPKGPGEAFIADVIAGKTGLEQQHFIVTLGPALYAEVKALDPSIEQLGNAVAVVDRKVLKDPNALAALDPNEIPAVQGRTCAGEVCAKFLLVKGLRDFLLPFGAARYRSASSEELEIMVQRSSPLPEGAPATVAVAGAQVLGIYMFEGGFVWMELLSKPMPSSISSQAGAPPA